MRRSEKNKNGKRAVLLKVYSDGFEKPVYRGTLRGAKKRIKPSQKDRFKIVFQGS